MIGASGMTGFNPYGTPNVAGPPAWMQPVQNIADRMVKFESGQMRPGYDPLLDPTLGGYAKTYHYDPTKWLLRYGVESTVGTQSGFKNLENALFGSPGKAVTPKPGWAGAWEKTFTQNQKLFNLADKHLNNDFYRNIHSNPFAQSDAALAAKGGNATPTIGTTAMTAAASSPALYGMKALNYDEILGLSSAEKARIAAVRQHYGWKQAFSETFNNNRLAHAKDVLSEGGKTGWLKNFFKKTLINNEVRWVTEPIKKGEVLPTILRSLGMGLVGWEWLKTIKRSYTVAEKEGKSTMECLWEGAKTAVTKGAKLFTAWHVGTLAFKAMSLTLGTAIGLPTMLAGGLSILGAVGVGWALNTAMEKVLPDPPVYDEGF